MSIVRFGPFEVDRDSGELRSRGLPIRLREQPTRVLLALLDGGGRVVTREELRHRLWPDGVFVEFDRAINKAVWELRRALDRPGEQSLVETVSKRGYRLAAELKDPSRPCSRFVPAATELPSEAATAYVTGRYLLNRRRVPDLFTSHCRVSNGRSRLGAMRRPLRRGSPTRMPCSEYGAFIHRTAHSATPGGRQAGRSMPIQASRRARTPSPKC